MIRVVNALRLEVTLARRQKFLHAAIFSGLIWLAVLLPMTPRLRAIAEPYILLGDISIIGFFFIGFLTFLEGCLGSSALGFESPRDVGYGFHRFAAVYGRRRLAARRPATTRPLIERSDVIAV
ncbi:hypothetical protein MAGR_09440 [Mycolicibacterium agri]|uniref:Uncharacterized protein n=1 Tax=Mycolicibacterium agri TaxID=36811 RepID=A0A7I9VVW6_MYCAG|nr:hypothetical protein MAGR_09440 [Mycolicibacterium agri]